MNEQIKIGDLVVYRAFPVRSKIFEVLQVNEDSLLVFHKGTEQTELIDRNLLILKP
jgi:hypothetical protein